MNSAFEYIKRNDNMNSIFVGQDRVEMLYNDFSEEMFGLGGIVKVILDDGTPNHAELVGEISAFPSKYYEGEMYIDLSGARIYTREIIDIKDAKYLSDYLESY